MYSMLVIGLGRFGANLAQRLAELGNEVMVIDRNEDAVDPVVPYVTASQIGDCMDIDVLRSIGADNFDVCFVCISDDFQASMEITSLLKELGAPVVVAKADRAIHEKLLHKIGADDVIYPERDMAQRTAVRYSTNGALEYVELTEDYAIFEMPVSAAWDGKTPRELNLRRKFRISIIGMLEQETVIPFSDPDYVFHTGERILAAGSRSDMNRLMHLFR